MTVLRDDVIGLLTASPLFAGIGRGELRQIADQLEEQHYLAGHRILTEGMSGIEFFLVVEGEATVESGGRVRAQLGPALATSALR